MSDRLKKLLKRLRIGDYRLKFGLIWPKNRTVDYIEAREREEETARRRRCRDKRGIAETVFLAVCVVVLFLFMIWLETGASK